MNVKIPLQNKKDLILYKEICLSKIQETVNDQNSNFDQKTMQKIKRRYFIIFKKKNNYK